VLGWFYKLVGSQRSQAKASPSTDPPPVPDLVIAEDLTVRVPNPIAEGSISFKVLIFYVVLFGLALACFLFSESLDHEQPFSSILTRIGTWSELSKELGYALIIAIAISVTIEASARRENMREVSRHMALMNRNVFGALFGVFLPKRIVDEVVNTILTARFIRDHYRLHFDMAVIDQPIGGTTHKLVRIYATHDYIAINTTPVEQEFEISLDLMDPPRSTGWPSDTVDRLYVNRERAKAVQFAAAPSEAGAHSADQYVFREKRLVPAGKGVHVRIRSTLYRRLEDNEGNYSITPSLKMSLSVKIPTELARFGAVAIHNSPVVMVSAAEDTGEYEWTIDNPVLPLQGIYFWWREG